jgi:phage tail-like protein
VGSDDLFTWLSGVRDGTADPRQVTITLLDEARNSVATWVLRNAQPKKWAGPTFAAKGGGEVAMEELHFVHEGIDFK